MCVTQDSFCNFNLTHNILPVFCQTELAFLKNLKLLIDVFYAQRGVFNKSPLPEDLLVNHISSSFVNTVSWWLSRGMKESPKVITEYFLNIINGLGIGTTLNHP